MRSAASRTVATGNCRVTADRASSWPHGGYWPLQSNSRQSHQLTARYRRTCADIRETRESWWGTSGSAHQHLPIWLPETSWFWFSASSLSNKLVPVFCLKPFVFLQSCSSLRAVLRRRCGRWVWQLIKQHQMCSHAPRRQELPNHNTADPWNSN
jgi:hypothetical protein